MFFSRHLSQLQNSFVVKRFRPEEIIALIAFVILTWLSLSFGRQVNLTPYILVMFVLFTPTFLIPMLVLSHKSIQQTSYSILKILRDWAPVVICLVIYENLHDMVHLINPQDYDQILSNLDEVLFGVQPTVYLEQFISPVLTELSYFAYMTYFFYPVISLGVLYYQRRLDKFRNLTLSIVMVVYLGFAGYVLVPAVGPQYALVGDYSVDLNGYQLSALQQKIDDLFRISRDCFPSLHFSLSAVILFMTYRHNRWLFWFYLPCVLGLWFSTVYLRYHYVVDLLAGIPLIMLVLYSAPRLNSWWFATRN
ncbi:phosphatase PAP2 family protein [candidate division CSSED10-310 bacterium]|uniref:Phosphatase PAP2 family protein n=1 Tax=candidate division CSSED10-310 bacterium TaxID=2855610 RepID=A0ABV6YV68_UNCC1